jgi:hypothetical protein
MNLSEIYKACIACNWVALTTPTTDIAQLLRQLRVEKSSRAPPQAPRQCCARERFDFNRRNSSLVFVTT